MKKEYVDNYVKGMYILYEYNIELISNGYGCMLISTLMNRDQALEVLDKISQYKWELDSKIDGDKSSREFVWKYSTGPVMRGG